MQYISKPMMGLIRALVCCALIVATPATASIFGSAASDEAAPWPALDTSSPEPDATTMEAVVAPSLKDFGFALATVDRQTIRELAPFSSLVDIPWDHPELAELVTYARSYDMKALISVHGLFFDHNATRSWFLRPDYHQRWQEFVGHQREILGYGSVWAFYLVDEPFWNEVPLADLITANATVKQSFPLIPTMASMNRHDIDAAPSDLPSELFDIAGYHAYATPEDPNTDPDYQHYLRLFQNRFAGRDFVIVADAWWQDHPHGTVGLQPSHLAERAGQYRRVAEDIDAIALGAFIWQGLPGSLGLRELPEDVQRQYIRIGSEISDKCGVPESMSPLAGETALFLQGCRFYATAHWRDPATGQQGEGVGVRLTKDSGVFWFFEPSNVELTVKLLDGGEHNGHWWVFWSHMTSLEVWLEVTDASTGARIRYLAPGADTAAFPAVPSRRTVELKRK